MRMPFGVICLAKWVVMVIVSTTLIKWVAAYNLVSRLSIPSSLNCENGESGLMCIPAVGQSYSDTLSGTMAAYQIRQSDKNEL